MKVITDAGATIAIGETEAAPTIGIVDYSRRVTDDFGVTTVVERGFSRTMSIKAAVPFDQVSALQLQLADLRAEPATWVADDRFASLVVRGFFKDLQFDLAAPPISYCTLTVEGLASAEPLPDDALDPAPGGQLSTLQVLRPVEVTGGMLSYSSVAEDDAPEWAAGATYPAGARVMLGAGHRVYESLIPLNTGKHPVDSVGAWLDAGPTNRWAMFDQALGTATRADRQVQVTVAAGAVNAVGLIDVKATSVRVQSGGYDRTASATSGTVTFLDLPGGSAPVTITVSGDAGVEIGTLLVGQLSALGITEASPTAAITDFSRKVIDDFGEVTIVKRAFAKTMSARALIDTAAVDVVAARIANVRAKPCLWIGQDGVAALTIYGFFKEFSVEIGETFSKLSLSIEGMSAAAKVKPLGSLVDWPDIADPAGTKPDNNATNTAKPDAPFGPGGTVGKTTASIQANLFGRLLAAANGETARLRTRALNFPGPDGEDSFTLLRRETTERKDADGVFAETFDLLLARTPDGQAVVLKTETVRISDTETLAQRFDLITASFSEQSASIEHIDQVLVGPDGASARALVTVDVNGRIVGTALTNDGSEGGFVVSADNFRLEDPDTGKPYFYADDTGKLLARDVEVDTLKVGAVGFDALSMGAVQKCAFYTLPGTAGIKRLSTAEVATLSFVKEDADSILEIIVLLKCASDDDLQFDTTIQIDGMVMDTIPTNAIMVGSNSRLPITPFVYAAGIGAGPRTVSVKIYNRESDADDLSILAGSTLKVTELRKGSIGSSTGSGGAIPPPSSGGGSGGGGGGYNGGPRPVQV